MAMAMMAGYSQVAAYSNLRAQGTRFSIPKFGSEAEAVSWHTRVEAVLKGAGAVNVDILRAVTAVDVHELIDKTLQAIMDAEHAHKMSEAAELADDDEVKAVAPPQPVVVLPAADAPSAAAVAAEGERKAVAFKQDDDADYNVMAKERRQTKAERMTAKLADVHRKVDIDLRMLRGSRGDTRIGVNPRLCMLRDELSDLVDARRSFMYEALHGAVKDVVAIKRAAYAIESPDVGGLWLVVCKRYYLPHPKLSPDTYNLDPHEQIRREQLVKKWMDLEYKSGQAVTLFASTILGYQRMLTNAGLPCTEAMLCQKLAGITDAGLHETRMRCIEDGKDFAATVERLERRQLHEETQGRKRPQQQIHNVDHGGGDKTPPKDKPKRDRKRGGKGGGRGGGGGDGGSGLDGREPAWVKELAEVIKANNFKPPHWKKCLADRVCLACGQSGHPWHTHKAGGDTAKPKKPALKKGKGGASKKEAHGASAAKDAKRVQFVGVDNGDDENEEEAGLLSVRQTRLNFAAATSPAAPTAPQLAAPAFSLQARRALRGMVARGRAMSARLDADQVCPALTSERVLRSATAAARAAAVDVDVLIEEAELQSASSAAAHHMRRIDVLDQESIWQTAAITARPDSGVNWTPQMVKKADRTASDEKHLASALAKQAAMPAHTPRPRTLRERWVPKRIPFSVADESGDVKGGDENDSSQPPLRATSARGPVIDLTDSFDADASVAQASGDATSPIGWRVAGAGRHPGSRKRRREATPPSPPRVTTSLVGSGGHRRVTKAEPTRRGVGRARRAAKHRPTTETPAALAQFWRVEPRRQPRSASPCSASPPLAGDDVKQPKPDEANAADDDEQHDELVGLVLDSGATSTICNGRMPLRRLESLRTPQSIATPDPTADSLTATQKGELHVGEHVVITALKSKVKRSLISVSQLASAGFMTIFDNGHGAVVRPRPGHDVWEAIRPHVDVAFVAEHRGKLYHIDNVVRPLSGAVLYGEEVNAAERAVNPADLVRAAELAKLAALHARMGHVSYDDLRRMLPHVPDADRYKSLVWTPEEMRRLHPCMACAVGKIHDHSHQAKATRRVPSGPGDTLFADTSGRVLMSIDPKRQPELAALHKTFGEWAYFDLVVDDHSKMVFLEVLARKDEVADWRMRCIQHVQKHGGPCKYLMMDRGGENRDARLAKYALDQGISIQFSAANHKEQLGQVERYMRTFWERALAMCEAANLHVVFAKHALYYAEVLLGCTVPRGAEMPRRQCFYREPMLLGMKHFWAFGCDAVVQRELKAKADTKGDPAIYLGHSRVSPATYVVLRTTDMKLVESTRVHVWDGQFTLERERLGRLKAPVAASKIAVLVGDDVAQPPARRGRAPANGVPSADDADAKYGGDVVPDQKLSDQELDVNSRDHISAKIDDGEDGGDDTAADPDYEQPTGRPVRNRRQVDRGPYVSEHVFHTSSQQERCDGWPDHVGWQVLVDLQLADRHELHATVVGPHTHAQVLQLTSQQQRDGYLLAGKEELAKVLRDTVEAVNESDVPRGGRIIGSRLVLTMKVNDKKETVFKGRLCAQDFRRKWQPVAVTEANYAPVAQAKSVRLVLALGTSLGMRLHQYDINSAFLHADYDKEVYIRPPKGWVSLPGAVWRLRKSLYGLRDAPKQWYDTFVAAAGRHGFRTLPNLDPCVMVYQDDKHDVLVIQAVHVDDNLAAIRDNEASRRWWARYLGALNAQFGIKDLGEPTWLLGMTVCVAKGSVHLSQRTLVERALEVFGLQAAHQAKTPLDVASNSRTERERRHDDDPASELSDEDVPPAHNACAMGGCEVRDRAGGGNSSLCLGNDDISLYRKMVGTLNYLACMTRPDIAYAVHVLAKHMCSPSAHYMEQARRVFRYLKGTAGHGLLFAAGAGLEAGSFQVRAVSDSAFADGVTSGYCTYGYVLYLGRTVVHWVSRRQTAVAEWSRAQRCRRPRPRRHADIAAAAAEATAAMRR